MQLVALNALVSLATRRFTSDLAALAIALWFAFGSLLRPAADNLAPDVLSSLVVLGAVLALLSAPAGGRGLPLRPLGRGKVDERRVPAARRGVRAARAGLRPALRFAAASAPQLAALAILNWHMFGSPLTTPYDRVLGPGGTIQPGDRTMLDGPFWAGLWQQIEDPRLGLVPSAPQTLFALPGFALLLRRARAEAALVAACCAAQLAVFAPYRCGRRRATATATS